jgi:hypothetical protein
VTIDDMDIESNFPFKGYIVRKAQNKYIILNEEDIDDVL